MRQKIVFLVILSLLMVVLTRVDSYADSYISEAVPRSTLTDVPLYDGEDCIILQNNQPDFYVWQIQTESYVSFSALDSLGRTGPGIACLGPETMPTQTRGQIGGIHPSGWHTVRYDDLIEDKYLYNRAHVIGFSLCADNATPENLFTGTRYLNASSMLPFENQVADYINMTKNHVIYRCSPIYHEDDLVATGVQMEAYSVEDYGALCFNVFLFNIQPGIIINYATGESERSTTRNNSITNESQPQETPSPQEANDLIPTYVANANTHKFHRPSCDSVNEIKEKNKLFFYGTRDEAIAAGYDPCGRCHP